MGRTKKSESPVVQTKQIDAKSRAIEKAKDRASREKAQKSYREPSDSEEEVAKIASTKDQDFSDEEPSISEASGSDYEGESSGSEYGGKKKKKTPSKAVGKGKGRGKGGRKAAASPKGKGRGRGRPGAAAKNGSKKSPVKRGRDASDDSEDSEAAGSSGSEYGKSKKVTPSPKKRAAPAKKTPKAAPKKAVSSPVESNRARRGRPAKAKSYKEVSEDDELEVSEEEKKPVSKRAKLEPKKKEKKVSEDEEEMSVSEDENASEKEKVVKKNGNGHAAADKKAEKEDKDSESEEEDKKSEKSDKSDKSDVESEEEPKEKEKKEKSPAPADEEDEKASQLKNRTDTDFSKIDFECDKKTSKGDPWDLKISCWNIGGIKSWVKKNGLEYLKKENPDVMCLVEVKCNEKTKPEELSVVDGYPHIYWAFNSENSGHHGVGILSKTEPKNVVYGLPVEDTDSAEDQKAKERLNTEGRLITLEYENHYLINAYVPNSGRAEKSDDFPKGYPPKVASGERQKFDKFFRSYIQELEKKKPVIVTGDLNVSHEEIDLANPKTNERTAGFTKEEREGMTQLLEDTTLVDSFRSLYPEKKESYTFWSYMHNSRLKNIGWRLDYFLVSDKLQDSVCENLMRTEVFGSDHCPIVLFLKN